MPEIKTVEQTKWFTTKEAAKEAGVKHTKIMSNISAGRIITKKIPDSSRIGYHYLISENELMDWVEEPKKVRTEPVPSKARKLKKTKETEVNNDKVTLAMQIIEMVEAYVREEAYNKGYQDGKEATVKAMTEIINKLG